MQRASSKNKWSFVPSRQWTGSSPKIRTYLNSSFLMYSVIISLSGWICAAKRELVQMQPVLAC